MNIVTLAAEVQREVYAGLTDEALASAMNMKDQPVLQQRWISARTLYAELPNADIILGKIETAAQNNKLLSRVYAWLNAPGDIYPGIDIGDAGVQAMVGSLVDVLDSDEIVDIQALGYTTISRAEQLGLGKVLPGHIMKARAYNADN